MKVRIKILENALLNVFKNIKETYGEDYEIDLNADYYWNISEDDLYDVENDPKDLSIGSLVDDLKETEKIHSEEYYAVPLNLVKISSLLRYIGNNVH